jgi:hypothetical protein
LIFADSRFDAGRHERLTLASRRHLRVDETDAAVGIRVLLLSLDTDRFLLALHLDEKCARTFDCGGEVAAFNRHGRRRRFSAPSGGKDDRDNANGDGQYEDARALLPGDHL